MNSYFKIVQRVVYSFLLVFGLSLGAYAETQTVVITSPNYQSNNLSASRPDTVSANPPTLSIWNYYSYTLKGLIRFDLASGGLPADAVVQSAKLSLYITYVPTSGNFSVYSAINDNWPANVTAATWNNLNSSANPVIPWSAGRGVHTGSYNPAPLSTVPLTSLDVNTYRDWDVTSAVQGWLNGSIPNYGLLIIYFNKNLTQSNI